MTGWWRSLTFHLQFFLVAFAAIGCAVIVLEVFIDPIADAYFSTESGVIEWEELPLWLLIALVMSGGLAIFLYMEARRRWTALAKSIEEVRRGNFAARISTSGNPNDHINSLSHSFNVMAETIDRLMRNERRLLADISHELRSPLARLIAAAEMLRLENSDIDKDLYLDKMAGDLEHMQSLISVLLEQGRVRLAALEERKRLDLSDMAREAADGFQMRGETQRKTLFSEIEPGVEVEAHPVQILIILENILDNALFYTPVEGRLELRVGRAGGFAQITVRDWGVGVPEEKLPSLFKAFFRVDPARARKSGGIGLGLALVQEACQALGGSVAAKNAFPGLEVRVLLPLAKA